MIFTFFLAEFLLYKLFLVVRVLALKVLDLSTKLVLFIGSSTSLDIRLEIIRLVLVGLKIYTWLSTFLRLVISSRFSGSLFSLFTALYWSNVKHAFFVKNYGLRGVWARKKNIWFSRSKILSSRRLSSLAISDVWLFISTIVLFFWMSWLFKCAVKE